MNLNDLDSSGSSDADSDNEIVPLDFRTALIQQDNKIIIQAKPLHFKTVEDDLRELLEAEERTKKGLSADDDFFDKISRDPFKENDKDVVLIDPGIDAEEIFGGVELPCNVERRKNNTVDGDLLGDEDTPRQIRKAREDSQEKKSLA